MIAATYKTLCLSFYNADIANLTELVKKLRALGWSGANRSALVRILLSRLDDAALAAIAVEMQGRR